MRCVGALHLLQCRLAHINRPCVRGTARYSVMNASGEQHMATRARSDESDPSAYIDGAWHREDHGERFEVLDPATGRPIARLVKSGADATNRAIDAAASALPSWQATMAAERGRILERWHEVLLAKKDEIAAVMTEECGKPLNESSGEIASGLASVRVRGQVLQPTQEGRTMLTIKQPVGVVAAITPWNFPFSMITRKVAPALAAGCTVVLKPSEETPLTAFAMLDAAQEAGFPAGVLNVVTGDAKAIGETLMSSHKVRKVGFTGSTRVGKLLIRQSADTVKRVSMELGGNAPFIVFPDADLQAAAAAVVASSLRNAGQTCICANRTLVHESIYEEFVDLATKSMRSLSQGPGASEGTDIGPCINQERVDLAQAHVDDAVERGAEVRCGGGRPSELPDGFFFAPTLLAGATPEMRVFREETFAPVVPVFKFSTEDEAVAMANDTEYGLAAYFFSKDMARVWRVAARLEYGMIGVNETSVVSATAPFGGVKQSGLGRENGPHGIDEFLEEKYICMQH